MAKTITVAGYFGKDKEITKDEFVKEWTDHTAQLKRIDWSLDWNKEVDEMIQYVKDRAELEFDRVLEEQSK
jgi:hypothetical protein